MDQIVLRLLVTALIIWNITAELTIWGAIDNSEEELDESAVLLSYGTCYQGFSFTRCKANQADDDTVFLNDLPYYRNFDDVWGINYCLQCCGEDREFDIWDLKCEVDADTGPETNFYGYELRMARNEFETDTEIITCPIKRSACTYNESDGTLIFCDVENDDTYLVGVEVTLEVVMMSKNFFSWRSVRSCSVIATESTVPLATGDYFREKYIIYHSVGKHQWNPAQIVLLWLISVLGIYVVLYYCRRQRCIVCAKKLVFFKDMCYLCRFYGADPPDPLLLKAMEEKGEFLQGDLPERFPGSRRCVSFCEGIYRCIARCCSCCGKCCKCCGKCCWYMWCCWLPCCRKKEAPVDPGSVSGQWDGDADGSISVSTNPTAVGLGPGVKAPKKKKVNPYLIKVHPYFVYKALDHPHPPEPPEWVKKGVLEEDQETKEGRDL